MSTKRMQDDFGILLDEFDEIIEGYPLIENVKGKLEGLKEKVKHRDQLTDHQRSAVSARCDNYLSNQYGDQRKTGDSRSDYQKKLN